ncbi:permease [Caloranaerobacter azorensis H53214]|uniref:Permease n=1 Tax=Caloranaerobacter azorensis H53214 TaxID=1156417 RepID=A0A096BFD3_9FIRM|nr:permease [Caloranaerobacter azorensis]KGG79453.1 permease [Caloranaerobacter azorensis H53214]
MKLIKRYSFPLIGAFIMTIITLFNRNLGIKAFNTAVYSIKEMILVIPPVFIVLGLLDIWVPRETMVKYMGENSGLKGIVLAIILGSAAAGPLYGAFPIAAVFMKKGVKFSNVLIFIGAWSTTKIPMFLFEMSSLGVRFAVTRLLIDIPGIIIIAHVLNLLLTRDEIEKIYKNAESILD